MKITPSTQPQPSVLLRAAATPILMVQVSLSFFLLLRGHNEPGGGFSGGLLAAAAIALYATAFDVEKARNIMRFPAQAWIGIGLTLAAASGLLAPIFRLPYMTGFWGISLQLPFFGKIEFGTPLLFDVGVYFTVIGMTSMVIFALFERGHGTTASGSDPPSGGTGLSWD
jgi:multicomponent Na+:H+ antiporter subunit B